MGNVWIWPYQPVHNWVDALNLKSNEAFLSLSIASMLGPFIYKIISYPLSFSVQPFSFINNLLSVKIFYFLSVCLTCLSLYNFTLPSLPLCDFCIWQFSCLLSTFYFWFSLLWQIGYSKNFYYKPYAYTNLLRRSGRNLVLNINILSSYCQLSWCLIIFIKYLYHVYLF